MFIVIHGGKELKRVVVELDDRLQQLTFCSSKVGRMERVFFV